MNDAVRRDDLIGQSLGGYRITSYIARGGMGEVYRAIQESLDRPVAVKVLSPRFSAMTDFQQRFEREARVASRLDHPNALRILDFGVQDTIYFMVLDLVDGGNLRDLLRQTSEQGERLPLDRTVEIVSQVGEALNAAHDLGFIHRDVKPGNVLFRRDGRPVLADFGVVKDIASSDLTTPGTMFGVPRYKAPEEFADDNLVGPATDQYALAVMAYEMTVGQPPFDAPTLSAMMLKHVSETPPTPTDLAPDLPPGIDQVLVRALAKLPEDRYPSVSAFVADLTEALEGGLQQPQVSVPPPEPPPVPVPAQERLPGTQTSRPRERPRGLSIFLIVSLFFVALVVGFVAIVVLRLLLG